MDFIICPVCDDHAAREPFFYEWHDRRHWIMRCKECTHQFVHPPVTSEEQQLIYDDHYFSRDGDWVCGVFDSDYVSAEPDLRAEAIEILNMIPRSSGRLLDIGCAGGVFLDEARRRGFHVRGVELNPSMARHAKETFGLDVVQGRVEDIGMDRWEAEFDVVTLLDVLEHIPSPKLTLAKAATWLMPDGFLFIRGPMSNGLIAHAKESLRRALGIKKKLSGYPLDANTFNARSLNTLLAHTGFRVISYINKKASFANVLAQRT